MDESEKQRLNILRMIEERNEIDYLEDGFLYYFPSSHGGLSAWNLRVIADDLDRRNEPWNKNIEEYFAGFSHKSTDSEEIDLPF